MQPGDAFDLVARKAKILQFAVAQQRKLTNGFPITKIAADFRDNKRGKHVFLLQGRQRDTVGRPSNLHWRLAIGDLVFEWKSIMVKSLMRKLHGKSLSVDNKS